MRISLLVELLALVVLVCGCGNEQKTDDDATASQPPAFITADLSEEHQPPEQSETNNESSPSAETILLPEVDMNLPEIVVQGVEPIKFETADPVSDGLAWLARAQEPDGRWDSQKWGAKDKMDTGITGIALLTFLSRGTTDREGKHRSTVSKALEYLEGVQREDGSFDDAFDAHGICTAAFAEAYGLTRNQRWKTAAKKAVDYCAANQNPDGGWDQPDNTKMLGASVTGWVAVGIKCAMTSGLEVSDETVNGINQWLLQAIDDDAGEGAGDENYASLAAVVTKCRILFDWDRDELKENVRMLDERGVDLDNLYYTYCATIVMAYIRTELWDRWNLNLRDPLTNAMVRQRGLQFDGSWDFENCKWGQRAGRVYTTALAVMSLEAWWINRYSINSK